MDYCNVFEQSFAMATTKTFVLKNELYIIMATDAPWQPRRSRFLRAVLGLATALAHDDRSTTAA